MKYEDAFEDCLRRLSNGGDLASCLAVHPEHAARLRGDLRLAQALRSVSQALPPAPATGANRMQLELARRRDTQLAAASQKPRVSSPLFGRGLAMAAVAMVAVLTVALLARNDLPGLGTAEAASIEGVVVESSSSALTLQTDVGLQTVQVPQGAPVSSETGASVNLLSVEPGQLATIRLQKPAQGVLAARSVRLAPDAALPAWCSAHPARCQEIESALQRTIERCAESACPLVRSRLMLVHGQLQQLQNLSDLRDRCERGNRNACLELQTLCRLNTDICKSIESWLRDRLRSP